jgi:hypothetical protein
VLLCVGVLAGSTEAARRGTAQLPRGFNQERMYVQASPYGRLYVKVDRVEGVAVDPRWLAELKDFLATNCRKPDGVEVAQGAAIPLATVKGLSPSEIAGMRIEGPPSGAGGTAWLYVLFYDSKKLGLKRPDNPHVSYGDYPCAIYYDVAYARREQGYFAGNALRHEAGHALGLCKDRSHSDGAHCKNKACLMYWTFVLRRDWFRHAPVRKQLCEQCQQDLKESQAAGPDGRFSFSGPVLVRQEKDYWVLSYPGLVGLAFDKQHAMDWQGLLRSYRAWIQTQGKGKGSSIYAVWQLKAEGKDGIDHLRKAIEKAKRDSSPLVQDTAKEAQRELQKELKRRPEKIAASLEREWADGGDQGAAGRGQGAEARGQ